MLEFVPLPETTTPPGASRPTFHDEIVNRSVEFAQALLEAVPELEGVTIVPSCAVTQHNVASGITVGRHGPLRLPGEIMHMATQLHGCLKIQLDHAYECLREIDAYMAERQELLETLENNIRERRDRL